MSGDQLMLPLSACPFAGEVFPARRLKLWQNFAARRMLGYLFGALLHFIKLSLGKWSFCVVLFDVVVILNTWYIMVTIFMLDYIKKLLLNLPIVPIGLVWAQQHDKQYHLPVFFIIVYSVFYVVHFRSETYNVVCPSRGNRRCPARLSEAL